MRPAQSCRVVVELGMMSRARRRSDEDAERCKAKTGDKMAK